VGPRLAADFSATTHATRPGSAVALAAGVVEKLVVHLEPALQEAVLAACLDLDLAATWRPAPVLFLRIALAAVKAVVTAAVRAAERAAAKVAVTVAAFVAALGLLVQLVAGFGTPAPRLEVAATMAARATEDLPARLGRLGVAALMASALPTRRSAMTEATLASLQGWALPC